MLRAGSDYKGKKGAQIFIHSEFHHIIGTAIFVPKRHLSPHPILIS